MSAALNGMGLVQIAEPMIADHVAAGRLRVVLDKFASNTPGLFLYIRSATRSCRSSAPSWISFAGIR